MVQNLVDLIGTELGKNAADAGAAFYEATAAHGAALAKEGRAAGALAGVFSTHLIAHRTL